ncbi:hypothetical protein JD844_025929 [Phrynosoma platyrhinos]|uniref:Uncharacterized protein n=1 Tax=Phrynosoma platyrhinos TaxID=52577 RepID=A0ABQ7SZS2_PHRPL|nr:hypothetical protein JD844_025929 [Phrynosoma platyrhinos]
MSNTRCQPLNVLLLPLALVILVVISGFLPQHETLLLYLLTCFITLAHIHYGVGVSSTSLGGASVGGQLWGDPSGSGTDRTVALLWCRLLP